MNFPYTTEADLQAIVEARQRERAARQLSAEAQREARASMTLRRAAAPSRIARALRACGEGDWSLARDVRDESDALARELGIVQRSTHGFYVTQRDLSVAATPQLVGKVSVEPGTIAGSSGIRDWCTVIPFSALRGTGRPARLNALPTVTVLTDELTQIAETNPTTPAGALAPRNCGSYVEESRQWVLQSPHGAEAVIEWLRAGISNHQAVQALTGSGASGNALGITVDSSVSTTVGTSLTWATVCSTMQAVEAAAGDDGLGWVVSAPAATILRQRTTSTGGEPILSANKTIAGYPVRVVANASAVAAFGRWKDFLVVDWAPLEIAVNPFANFPQGVIGVRAWATWDCAPLVSAHFATITGIT